LGEKLKAESLRQKARACELPRMCVEGDLSVAAFSLQQTVYSYFSVSTVTLSWKQKA